MPNSYSFQPCRIELSGNRDLLVDENAKVLRSATPAECNWWKLAAQRDGTDAVVLCCPRLQAIRAASEISSDRFVVVVSGLTIEDVERITQFWWGWGVLSKIATSRYAGIQLTLDFPGFNSDESVLTEIARLRVP